MIKPASIRAAVALACPQFLVSPEKLIVFVESGSISSAGYGSPSFEYNYVLNVAAIEYSGDADDLMLAVLEWVRLNQPNLLLNPDNYKDGITFDAEMIDHSTFDILIKVRVSETVEVKKVSDASGNVSLEFVHLPEPNPEPISDLDSVELVFLNSDSQ